MAWIAMDLMIGKIVSILENEAALMGGICDELDELKRELKSMRSFLEDADRRRGLTEGEKSWVEDVRDVCYPVEDIIEEFMYHISKQQRAGKFTKILYSTIHLPENMWVRHRVARKLQKINRKIKLIAKRSRRYGVNRIEGGSSHDSQRRSQNHSEPLLFAKDEHLVGIEDDECLLLDWLTSGEPQRTVISLVGMGGSGKSTLAAKVYKSQIVKRHFDCCAWITVSQTYAIEDVLRRMIEEFYSSTKKQIPADLISIGYKKLLQMLVDYLAPKRYVVVFDDVWSSNLWDDINVSLPDEGLRSRVMLTTPNEDIATTSFGVVNHVHHIKPLHLSDALDLFCTKAFLRDPNRSCPRELQNIAVDLVKKCGGLPLAILALGGVMSSKTSVPEWIDFSRSLNHELSSNPGLEAVKSILFLGFSDLPLQLKRCFLYCCIFPEDHRIQRKRLMRLWMAEGFVEQVRGKMPEHLAEDYLMELVHRSMLQVVLRNQSGRPKECKMHDLMRELALSTSEKEQFCATYDGREASEAISRSRRLSIQGSSKDLKSLKGMSQIRSLFVFGLDTISPLSANGFASGHRLLRVMDLENVSVEKLPDEVGNLFNLRYLNLRGTKVKKLPNSIGRLRNLQTLDVRDCKIEVLPAGIVKLQKLRHMLVYRYTYNFDSLCSVYGVQAPSSICKLNDLQVLDSVEAEPKLLKQLRSMTQLTCIGITKVRKADEKELCIAIQSMDLLHKLMLMVTDEEECLGINAISSPPPCLRKLALAGKLENVPCWFYSLHSLTKLHLHWSKLNEDPLPHIQALANLRQLVLSNAYAGKKLNFSTGFRRLTRLHLYNLARVTEIIIEEGVMPSLQRLYLINRTELKMLPRGIQYLLNLELLYLERVSPELIESIRGKDSVDQSRIRHIPEISHYYESNNGLSHENLSIFDFKKGRPISSQAPF
ncbi:hypothetical protein RJ640_009656 [Escallonia rubra]|uniref:Disease resistance protein RPM1 n=1 Tax=Escallonia rubra TaxID=112253 RepID=A0AA88QLN2_9ASTE|nr:hypothetical protein RJ640_009656 [Escallonia rubra]